MPDNNIINLNQKELFKALKSFPVDYVYSLAPKRYVKRGLDYYEKNSLLDFNWSYDYSSLTAIVYGRRHYSVDISLSGNDLALSCNCPDWSTLTQCKHVICTLITIKNLFQPFSSGYSSQNTRHRAALTRRFFITDTDTPASDKAVLFEIVLEISSCIDSVYVRADNKKVHQYVPGMPKELKPFVSSPYYVHSFLKHHLLKHGKAYPISIQKDGKETKVEFDENISYSCKTLIDAKKSFISVNKICTENGRENGNFFIENDFLIDFDSCKIGFLHDKGGWELWNDLLESTGLENDFITGHDEESFRIPANKFKQSQIIVPAPSPGKALPDNLLLKVRGHKVQPEKAAYTYQVTLFQSRFNKDMFKIKAECSLNGSVQSPSPGLFSFFTSIDYRLSNFLRTIKRKTVLYKAFFNMLSAKNKTTGQSAINKALSEGDFKKAKIKLEASCFLNDYLTVFFRNEQQLQLRDNNWTISPVDKRKESLLYRVPYEVFGPKIFRNILEHDRMLVPADELHEKLPLLYEKFREHNIDLFYKNSRVVESKWDFAFNAKRPNKMDWFEIKPEIKCDGKFIDESEWIELLRKNTITDRDGVIRIMDTNTQKLFDLISTIYSTRKLLKIGGRGKQIVRIPRLQILDWIDLRNKGIRISLPLEEEKILESLGHIDKIPNRPIPSILKAKLRPYQKDAYYWLSFLLEHRFGACLADDMGLGKTVEALSLLAGIKEGLVKSQSAYKSCPHLIVVPPSLLFNWESEINRFVPDLKIYMYSGKERNTSFNGYDIVLTTYGLVRRDIEILNKIRFNVIIFDEAQAIKNIYSDTTGAVRQLSANFSLTMTGTPLENHVGEYYSIIDLVLPGLLGEYSDFKPLIKQESSPDLEIIIKRTRPFVLRRTKSKILKDLPPKIENNIYLELTEKQKVLYKKTVEQVKSNIDYAYNNKTEGQAKIIALTAILKLRQLCISPSLISGELKDRSPKIDFLIIKLKELLDEGHSALVFSQFTSFLDILENSLKKHSMDFLRMDGSTPLGKRKRLIENFQSGEGPSIFLLSLKVGGQGLNLTRASYVFHLDPWWNPAVENQASDRAHRIGQKNKVTITRILTHHTIEEKMILLKKKKLALYRAVMDDSKGHGKSVSISRADLNFLLN